jgi:uncharacterized protein with ParB-like and HNH nuclease domain
MQNGNIKLKDLFNADRIFNVPKYQRAFAWETSNLKDFLEDLLNQRGEKSYFLGTLLFHQKSNKGDYEYVDIVDGQQRLTTVVLFAKVIISLLKNKESELVSEKTHSRYIYDGECYTLELENEDNSFLHSYILGALTAQEGIALETPSQKRLHVALSYFEKELSLLSLLELERIYAVLIDSDIIIYIVDKISDATQIFELLNDRGKKLTHLESVKSFLMYRIGCLDLRGDGEQAVMEIQDNFAAIYRYIEKHLINENDVLRYHTIAFEKSKTDDYKAPELYIKNKINQLFKGEIDANSIKKTIVEYVAKLKESFEIFSHLKTNSMSSSSLDQLFMIGRVNPFYPQLMHLLHHKRNKLETFVDYLKKFTFKASLIGLRNKNEKFYSEIRTGSDFVEQFKYVIDQNWWNINARCDEVLDYRNFYEWVSKPLVKYILFSYENHLRGLKGYQLLNKEEFFSDDKRTKLNIEHITAKKCKKTRFNIAFQTNHLHSLGNLVIDSTAPNSSKGRKAVEIKMTDYITSPFMSQNEINEEDVNWSNLEEVKEFIDKRNDRIIDFIKTELF